MLKRAALGAATGGAGVEHVGLGEQLKAPDQGEDRDKDDDRLHQRHRDAEEPPDP